MTIQLKAPEGYKYQDNRTGRQYSVIVVSQKDRVWFELVPDKTNYSKN